MLYICRMKMRMKILALFLIAFVVQNTFAQIQIKSIAIHSSGVTATNYFETSSGGVHGGHTDTLTPPIDIVAEHVAIVFNDTDISYQVRIPSQTYIDTEINIFIDQSNHIIKALTASVQNTFYDLYPSMNTYHETKSYIGFQNVPYSYSKDGDTIKVLLDASQMQKINYSGTLYSDQLQGNSYNFNLFRGSNVIKITQGASLSVVIVASASLSVSNSRIETTLNTIKVDHKTLIMTYSPQLNNISCFDLLGRKHNLEFLGTDGTASTYSVRSLRSGVYFVSDGKEMVKFMIGE